MLQFKCGVKGEPHQEVMPGYRYERHEGEGSGGGGSGPGLTPADTEALVLHGRRRWAQDVHQLLQSFQIVGREEHAYQRG